jgi:hypothetical protein
MMNLQPYAHQHVIPSRTRYQLRHFVIAKHDTAPMQWRQVLIEAQSLLYNVRMAELDVRRKEIEIERLLATGDEIDAIEAEEKRLGIQLTERTLAGARMELQWLQEIAEETGVYTPEEIEADQAEYWAARLSRQAGIDQMATQQGIGAANLESMRLAGLLTTENQCDTSSGSSTGQIPSTEQDPSKPRLMLERS